MAAGLSELWHSSSLAAKTARLCLAPLAWIFGLAVRVRAWCYDRGVVAIGSVDASVVSIGNLSVGGSGKTPLVLWLLQRMSERGVAAVVVSRGYGVDLRRPLVLLPRPSFDQADATTIAAAASGADVVVIDGDACRGGVGDEDSMRLADEPLLIALRSGCAVVAWPDRVAAATIAVRSLAAHLIVLDDGFQHRRLHRDLDIVVLGDGDLSARLLPAGPLRERPRALARADVVVGPGGSGAGVRMSRLPGPLVCSVRDPHPQPASLLGGSEIVAFAGVARPRLFVESLRGLGASVREFIVFDDHHRYSDDDWRRILDASRGVSQIVTTEKDLVKLGLRGVSEPRLRALRLDVEIEGGDELVDRVMSHLVLDHDADTPHHRRLELKR